MRGKRLAQTASDRPHATAAVVTEGGVLRENVGHARIARHCGDLSDYNRLERMQQEILPNCLGVPPLRKPRKPPDHSMRRSCPDAGLRPSLFVAPRGVEF